MEEKNNMRRLDKAVQEEAALSRSLARRLIALGKVKLNGKICRVLAKEVHPGDSLIIDSHFEKEAAGPGDVTQKANDFIIYQDKYLLVINKPLGVICEDSSSGHALTAVGLLKSSGLFHPSDKFFLVHRLDATTTGLLLIARRPKAADALFAQFRERLVKKSYLALMSGTLEKETAIDGPIGREAPGSQRHLVRKDGKEAFTEFVPLAAAGGVTLTLCKPTTGRTHQIRVHSAFCGHPLLGDKLYGGPRFISLPGEEAISCNRALLHAYTIDFLHPVTHEKMHFEAPLPTDMAEIINALGLKTAAIGQAFL